MHRKALRAVVAATAVMLLAPAAESRPSAVPQLSRRALPLHGVPLRGPTGLRLLVADAPAPFVLDVDRGTVQRISGLPTDGERGVTVAPLGKDALVLSSRFCDRCRGSTAYLVRHGRTAAIRLGAVLDAVPAVYGRGVWIRTRGRAGRCTIRELPLEGRRPRAARQVSCRTGLVAELPAGLLVTYTGPLGRDAHSALLRPGGRIVRFRDPSAQPVFGNLVLSGADRRTPLLLHDMSSGVNRRLHWPGRPGYGLGIATGQPNGRLATVDFAKYSPTHRFDLWVLDTATRRWRHLPDMPAHVAPKATDVEWTADGRVVILATDVLGVWRPGEARLAVRRVKPPKQPGIKFVIW